MIFNNNTSDNQSATKTIETSEGEANKEVVETSNAQLTVELIEYVPNAIIRKTIMKKATGSVTVCSFDSDEMLTERISPFNTFIQIIEGNAEIMIGGNCTELSCGQSIIIPAHTSQSIKANVRFKMLQTIIKSGYDI